MMKKSFTPLLLVIASIGLIACNSSNANTSEKGETNLNNATIWGAPATEKILQDVHGIYDSFKGAAEINITAARGEYEAHHIIITAKDKKIAYTVEYDELKTSNGDVFAKENIDIFHEKYLELTTNFDRTEMPTGRYPDALVPYDAIVKAKENYVDANQNQGLYFRFNVPVDQKPGVYEGSATIKIGDNSKKIPISLTIEDITVSQVNHAKSHYLTRWFQSRGELDTTQEMHDKYSRALYEYRLNGSDLVLDNGHTKEDVEYYVNLAYDHMQNPKCSSVSIPCKQAADVGFDTNCLWRYLLAFANKSFETGYNMMDKLVFNNNYIDEPQYWGADGLPATRTTSTRYRNTITNLAKTLENDPSITSPIKSDVIKSLKKIPHIITAWYDVDYAPWVDTWCPTYDYYDAEYSRSNYDNQQEKWWYGCIDPHVPYPTYHIEDNLISARLEPWMKAEYDVVGSLYWSVSVYAEWTGSSYIDIEDYFSGSASRYPRVNGDGWLFYPGAKYGIDGPIGSLRLEAIRDGLEEYELLYALKNNYKNLKEALGESTVVSVDKIFSLLRSNIYYGTRVIGNANTFAEARKTLLELAKLNQSSLTSIVDYYDDSYGNYVFTVVAPEGTEIKNDNNLVTPIETINGYNKYSIKVNLVNEKNYFNLSATKNGRTSSYSQYLGGLAEIRKAENVSLSDFEKETVKPTTSLMDASTLDETLEGKLIKVDVPSSNANSEQAFRMKGELIRGINENTSKFILHVYSDSEEDTKFVVSARYQNNPVYFDIANTMLHKGMNTVEVKFEEKDWSVSGYIDYLSFYLGEGNNQPARTVYFGDSVIYRK